LKAPEERHVCSAGRQPRGEKNARPAPFPPPLAAAGRGKRLEIQQPRVDTLRYTHAAPLGLKTGFPITF